MARIGLNITVTGLTGKLIIRWVRPTAPLVEIGRSAAFNFPYDAVYTINDVDRVVYTVQLWRSDDGSSLDQLIKSWSIDASLVNVIKFIKYQYKVGRGWDNTSPVNTGTEVWADPVDLDTELVDERLDGVSKDDMEVHEAGYGDKLDAEYELRSGGGIILSDGKTFDDGVAWFITVSAVDTMSLADSGGPSVAIGIYTGIALLSGNQDFDNTIWNKLCICDWVTPVGVITFGALSLIPDNTHVTFNTHSGFQNYLKLQFNVGDTIKHLNKDVNVVYLAKCETISIFFLGGVAYITAYEGRGLQRGQIMADYDTSRATDSGAFLWADESLEELLEADYPGIYETIDGLPSGVVDLGTSAGQWSFDSGGGVYLYKNNFGIKRTDPKKFRVPHLSGRTIRLGGVPGAYEPDSVGPFRIDIREGSGGSSTGPIQDKGFSGQDNAAGWLDNGIAGSEKYIRPHAGSAAETTVKGVRQIPYIIL